MKRHLFLAMLLACALPALWAQQASGLVPLDSAVRRGVLPNGLTYYIRHNEWPEKRADFYIAQKVGSMQEEDDQRGLAHFLEHMCFNGTKHFPGDGLKQYLERIGVKFGLNLNAYTSYEETVYNINNVNVEIPGAVDSCMLILHDWSHDLLLSDEEIDKERGVINEEWRMRRTAQQRMQEAAFRDLFRGCRYAERSPIGTMDVVMNFPYETLRSYYRSWYRPDLQGIVIVGDVNVDAVEARLRDMFSDIPATDADAPVLEPCAVPDNDQTIVSIQKDKEFPMSFICMMFKMDALPPQLRGTADAVALSYVRRAIGQMMDERLQEIARKADAPFLQASVGYGPYVLAKTKDALSVNVVFREGEAATSLAAVYREVLRAQRGGFTSGEYERFKNEFASQIEAAYNSRDKVENTSYVNEYVRHFIDGDPAPGIEWEHTNLPLLAAAIPLEAVNGYMAQSVTPHGRAMFSFMPDKEGIPVPTQEELLAALQEVDGEEIEALKEEVDMRPLVPELPAGAGVRSIKPDVYGASLITLSNGIRVHALPTEYSPNEISFSAVSWGGTSLYPDTEFIVADNSIMVGEGGWGEFTATELKKKLAGIQAQVSPGIGERTESLKGSCVRKDLETMLQLAYLCFTAPHRDDEAFQSVRDLYVQVYRNQDLDPTTALQDSVISIFYGNNPRALRLRAEDVAALDYDRLLSIYGERFANAGDFDFYLVGDFEVDSVASLLDRYIGALPVARGREKYRDISLRMTKGERTCMFEKEQDTPNATVIFKYHAPVTYNLRNQLLTSFVGQTLQMLFTETVREDEGGAYGVPVRASISDYPEKVVTVTIQLPTSPDKVERMTQVIYDGLEKMAMEGPSEDYMQKIREYMARSHAENLKNNSYWMSQLINRTRENKDYVTPFDKELQSITAADVRKFASRIFHSGNRVVVGMKTPPAKN